jgi:hypothetical protein
MSEITVFGIKLGIWVLIGLLIFITFSHTGCSCSRIGLMEGMALLEGLMSPSAEAQNKKASEYQLNMVQEGFTGANINNGQSASYSLTNAKPVNTSSWFTPNLTYRAGKPPGKGVQEILDRPRQHFPLPKGEMLLFANTKFAPQCCPAEYSNSQGCACIDTATYEYLRHRGTNNVPYSEY